MNIIDVYIIRNFSNKIVFSLMYIQIERSILFWMKSQNRIWEIDIVYVRWNDLRFRLLVKQFSISNFNELALLSEFLQVLNSKRLSN